MPQPKEYLVENCEMKARIGCLTEIREKKFQNEIECSRRFSLVSILKSNVSEN